MSGCDFSRPSWRPPRHIRHQSRADADAFRKRKGIAVDGEDCPAPIGTFVEMKFPRLVIEAMRTKSIIIPTVIQMQGLPVA